MSVWKCCLCGPSDEPKSNGIVTQLVRFGNNAASLLLTYTENFTQRRAHTLPSSLQNKHPLTPLHMPALSASLIVPVHLSLLRFLFPLCFTLHYLSIYLQCVVISPSISSPFGAAPAMGLCPFIIHGVVLMAQAAMSDVNLCASKAHSASPRLSREGYRSSCFVLRYHTALNQHAQSHLGHIAHANSLLLFKPSQTTPPFMQLTVRLGKNSTLSFIVSPYFCWFWAGCNSKQKIWVNISYFTLMNLNILIAKYP